MSELLKVLDRLGGTGRLLVGGIGLATIAIVFYLVMSAGPASMTPAFTNLTPKQAGQVEAALAGAHISSQLGDAGSTVKVPSSKVDEARIAIANSKISLDGANQGLEQVMGLSVSATQSQIDAATQLGLEGTLDNQIEQIAGVDSATVNLTMPKQAIFLSDDQPASASILLNLAGGTLSDESVRGIQQLVSHAVSGLTPENVVITNERGELLTQTGSGISAATADKLSTDAQYSRRMASQAQSLLDTMLGVGQAAVVVNARLNADQTTLQSVTYGKSHGPVQATKDLETLKGGGTGASGIAGTASNVPGYAAGAGGSGNTNYKKTHSDSAQALDTTNTSTVEAGGQVQNMFVSLAFAAPAAAAKGTPAVPTARCASIPGTPMLTVPQCNAALAVQSSLGITPAGVKAGTDTFTAVQGAPAASPTSGAAPSGGLAGAQTVKVSSPGPLAMVQSHLREGLAAAGVIALLFLIRRSLKRRQALLGASEARWMPTLAAPPVPIEDIALPEPPGDAALAGASKKALQARVEELAASRPGDVAQQLRGWLSEDS